MLRHESFQEASDFCQMKRFPGVLLMSRIRHLASQPVLPFKIPHRLSRAETWRLKNGLCAKPYLPTAIILTGERALGKASRNGRAAALSDRIAHSPSRGKRCNGSRNGLPMSSSRSVCFPKKTKNAQEEEHVSGLPKRRGAERTPTCACHYTKRNKDCL